MSVLDVLQKTKGMAVSDVLDAMALDRLSHGNARLPRTWSTIRSYERLVAKGLARELDDPNPLLRVFTLIKSE
jgi:hypothetical protein